MREQTPQKIMLAVDGSEGALEAVRYISKIAAFQKMEAVLFIVRGKIPDCYWDLEKEPQLGWRTREVKAWEREYEKMIQAYMERAKKILWRVGFPKNAVVMNIHQRKRGFARDIVTESKRGYSAVVVGRKGRSKLKGLGIGSVSTKLLQRITFTPLIVVGKNPRPGKVLLALDGSENSIRTVDYAAEMLGDSDFEVGLVHVIRGGSEEFMEEAEKQMGKVFDRAKGRLLKSGYESHQVTAKIITGAPSRAGAIVQEAKEGGYGTIVVGRRGVSEVQEFFMGRVSNKVIQLAKNQAVWVVS